MEQRADISWCNNPQSQSSVTILGRNPFTCEEESIHKLVQQCLVLVVNLTCEHTLVIPSIKATRLALHCCKIILKLDMDKFNGNLYLMYLEFIRLQQCLVGFLCNFNLMVFLEVQILVGRGVVDWQADAKVAFHHTVAINTAFSVVLHQRRGMASAAPKRQPRLSSFIRAYGNVSFK